MSPSPEPPDSGLTKKTTIGKDPKRIVQLEKAASRISQRSLNPGLGLSFLLGVWIFTFFQAGAGDSYSVIAIAFRSPVASGLRNPVGGRILSPAA